MNMKKMLAGSLCAAMTLSCATSLAATKWEFSGYNTLDHYADQFEKIWYEVNENGVPTGNEKVEGYASKVEWKHDFYEKAFPHVGVNRLYLDDVRTGVTSDSGTTADWATEFKNETWEVKYPYNIYERLWSKVNNKTWTAAYANSERAITNADVFKYLGKQANVTSKYESFGFDRFRIIDKNSIEKDGFFPGKKAALTRWFGAKDLEGNYIVYAGDLLDDLCGNVQAFPFDQDANIFTGDSLSAKNSKNNYVVSNVDIADAITTYRSEVLYGPDYKTGGNRIVDTVLYYDELTDPLNPNGIYDVNASAEWFNPHILMSSDKPATIGWTNVSYEKAFPYNQYQYLIVDGVVLDGTWVAPNVWLPRVFRYTGGMAAPTVEWKYAFTEADSPNNVVFEKYLDGNATGVLGYFDERGGRYGIVLSGETKDELDYKLKSVYGVQDYKSDDITLGSYAYQAWVDVDDTIRVAAEAAMKR